DAPAVISTRKPVRSTFRRSLTAASSFFLLRFAGRNGSGAARSSPYAARRDAHADARRARGNGGPMRDEQRNDGEIGNGEAILPEVHPSRELVAEIRRQIDLEDRSEIASFGEEAQRAVAEFSDRVLR